MSYRSRPVRARRYTTPVSACGVSLIPMQTLRACLSNFSQKEKKTQNFGRKNEPLQRATHRCADSLTKLAPKSPLNFFTPSPRFSPQTSCHSFPLPTFPGIPPALFHPWIPTEEWSVSRRGQFCPGGTWSGLISSCFDPLLLSPLAPDPISC